MRFFKFTILACLLSMAAVSCVGPAGMDGKDGSVNLEYHTFRVNDWNIDWKNRYYYRSFPLKPLDDFILQDGVVVVYKMEGEGRSKVKYPLPYTVRIGANIQNHYSFEYTYGNITFYVDPTNFVVSEADKPQPADFEVVFMW